MDGLRRMEAWTSTGPSELTRQRPNKLAHQKRRSPVMHSLATESLSTEWTDEKHSLYLNSMEASFVEQLYDSMNSFGWNSEKEKLSGSKSSRQTHFNRNASSDQFKVFQCGCWNMIKFERPAGYQLHKRNVCSESLKRISSSELHKRNGSQCYLGSSWIQHFRSGSKYQSSASLIEVSDQNFVDEEQVEKVDAKCSSKRLKL